MPRPQFNREDGGTSSASELPPLLVLKEELTKPHARLHLLHQKARGW